MIQAQRERAELLKRLLEASTPEERLRIVQENEAKIDEDFFRILQLNLEQASVLGGQEALQQLLEIQAMLAEQTPIGRRLADRTQAVRALREQPTRENLLNLLLSAEDEGTRNLLIRLGLPLVDYLFFQKLTAHIEAAETEAERRRLEALREEVLNVREKMREKAREVVAARLQLVRELLASEEPELLARRRLVEMDDLFLSVLASEIEAAQQAENEELARRLQNLWQLVMKLFQEQVPPELLLPEQPGRIARRRDHPPVAPAERPTAERAVPCAAGAGGEGHAGAGGGGGRPAAGPGAGNRPPDGPDRGPEGKKRETTDRRATPSGLIIARG